MGKFRDLLEEKGLSFVNEIKKEIKDVNWKDSVGYFSIDEEKYEVEFDEFTDNGNKVAWY